MIRRSYPPQPFTPDTAYLYAAWLAVLERAQRNEDFTGADDQPRWLNPDGSYWATVTIDRALLWAELVARKVLAS